MNKTEYLQGSDLPDLAISWYDANGQLIPFGTGYSFELKIGNPGETALITKTGNIVGADVAPNVTIMWTTTGELNALVPGSYRAQLKAQRAADNKQRYMTFLFDVGQAIL